jgi:RibD C-terminal domain
MTWDEWWTDRGHPSEHDPGPPRNRRWARLFAEVARLPVARRRGDRPRVVPLALRTDVLSGSPRGRPGQGAGRRPGGRAGRVAEPSLVHGWDRLAHAAPARAPGDHQVVPVPQHVLLPDLRAVRRSPPRSRAGSRLRAGFPRTPTASRAPPRRTAMDRSRSRSGTSRSARRGGSDAVRRRATEGRPALDPAVLGGRSLQQAGRPRDGGSPRPAPPPQTDTSIILGASVARQCLDAGALDELFVCVAPVLLGDGTRLFDHPGGTAVALERISVTQAPLATNLHLRVVR